ncbi:MAG: L,D-transpeptidase family protein [Bradyrhizobium sp.]|nr:L,D-transpeptidase family protein [Bradyrhizobium sp.]
MPHAIFLYCGFAICGTNDSAQLGGPASHGCVRLHPSHAAALFALVERNGHATRASGFRTGCRRSGLPWVNHSIT